MTCKKCHREYHESQCPACAARKRRRIILGAIAVTAVILTVLAILLIRRPSEQETPSAGEMNRTVLTCDSFSLTNTELGYYFWNEYFYLIGSYGDYLPASLDPSKPLDSQMYDNEQTWQDYLLDQTVETVEATMSMAFAAEEAGFTMPEDYRAAMERTIESMTVHAGDAGFTDESGQPDLLAYLAASYGPGVTLESFRAYMEASHLAAAYSDALYYEPTFTEQEISDYYDAYAGSYEEEGVAKTEEPLHTIRTVLIAPQIDDEAGWEEARTSADTLYATWQSESGTEDDFAVMAQTHSADADTAALGGLREEVRQSELSGELAEWTFDAARQAGDTAVVRSDDGWVIAYYVGRSERNWWQVVAEEDLRLERYQNQERTICEQYTFTVDRDAVCLFVPEGLYESSEAQLPAADD